METRVKFLLEPATLTATPRILGLFEHVGETWMSEDFNAVLPDVFWLGEARVTR